MAVISFSFGQLPIWRSRGFTQPEIRAFGDEAVRIMGRRIRAGVNLQDAPSKPLSKGYQKQKIRAGKQPIRNWDFTGATLAALGVVPIGFGSVGVGIDWRQSALAFRIALFNQRIEPMVGLSPNDRRELRVIIVQGHRRAA